MQVWTGSSLAAESSVAQRLMPGRRKKCARPVTCTGHASLTVVAAAAAVMSGRATGRAQIVGRMSSLPSRSASAAAPRGAARAAVGGTTTWGNGVEAEAGETEVDVVGTAAAAAAAADATAAGTAVAAAVAGAVASAVAAAGGGGRKVPQTGGGLGMNSAWGCTARMTHAGNTCRSHVGYRLASTLPPSLVSAPLFLNSRLSIIPVLTLLLLLLLFLFLY